MLLQLFIALCLVSVVLGNGCCTPDQWEGKEYVLGGFSRGLKRGSIANGFAVSYDATKQSVAVSGRYMRRGFKEPKEFKVIYNFAGSMGYFILPKEQKCKSYGIKGKFRKACIPEDAKFLGDNFFGAGDNKLEVSTYAMQYTNKSRRAYIGAVASVTKEGCIPVTEDVAGTYMRVDFFENVNFVGITGGIKDPTVFDPPEFCENFQDSGFEMLEEDFYENYSMLQFTHPGVAREPLERAHDDESMQKLKYPQF